MIRWPGKVKQKFDEQTLVSSIDIAPTILKACGLEVPASMPGHDLLDSAGLQKRNAVFGAAYEHDIHDVKKPNLSVETRYVVTGEWKLLAPKGGGGLELYQIVNDPHEMKNLAADQPEKAAALLKQLNAWWPGPQ